MVPCIRNCVLISLKHLTQCVCGITAQEQGKVPSVEANSTLILENKTKNESLALIIDYSNTLCECLKYAWDM